MKKSTRELTAKEKRSIRKLVTDRCANYDRSTAACAWTMNAICSAFAIPIAPCAAISGNRFCPMTRSWKQLSKPHPPSFVSIVASLFRQIDAESTAVILAPQQLAESRPPQGYESTVARKWICNDNAPKKHCSAMTFRGCFCVQRV